MIDEQLEFLISQYADGSLPEPERALVELRLQTDADARALLDQYRTLDATLKSSMPLPNVDWERLAGRLSEAVAAERQQQPGTGAAAVLGRIGFAGRLAVAACVVLAVGGVAVWTAMRSEGGNGTRVVQSSTQTGANGKTGPAPVVIVRGPAPEPSTAAPVVVVSVGPSANVAPNWRAAEGVVTGPSRAIWIASSYDGAQDTQRLPY